MLQREASGVAVFKPMPFEPLPVLANASAVADVLALQREQTETAPQQRAKQLLSRHGGVGASSSPFVDLA